MGNGFDSMKLINTLTEHDLLNEIGVTKAGHRRRIMMECHDPKFSFI